MRMVSLMIMLQQAPFNTMRQSQILQLGVLEVLQIGLSSKEPACSSKKQPLKMEPALRDHLRPHNLQSQCLPQGTSSLFLHPWSLLPMMVPCP